MPDTEPGKRVTGTGPCTARARLRADALAKWARCRQAPEVGAGCGNSARPDLCGGRLVIGVPTAIQTYVKVHGRWCYLYRAIDQHGNLVDVLLSEHRDMEAARAFFRSAKAVTGITPDRVTTDGHDSYPRAIRTELGQGVRHRTSAYLNNRLEQDHRGIKGRYRPMRGFKCPRSAARFCRAYDELRNFLRPRSRHHQHVPADCRRLLHLRRTVTVLAILQAA